MNCGLNPIALDSGVRFFGHSKGIPITVGIVAPDEDEDDGGDTGKPDPLASTTTLIDAGLVIDAGTVSVLELFAAAVPKGGAPDDPFGLAVWLKLGKTVVVAVMVLVSNLVSTRNTFLPRFCTELA